MEIEVLAFDDIFVDAKNPEETLLEIIGKIRPKWKKEHVQVKRCPGEGFVNTTLLVTSDDDVSDGIVTRIFDYGYDIVMHRDREMAALRLLNQRDLIPAVYCTFKNGFCLKYIQGRVFSWVEITEEPLRDLDISKAFARELAKYHSKKTMDLASDEKYSNVFPFESEVARKSRELMDNWPEHMQDSEADELFQAEYPSKAVLEREWKLMLAMYEELNQPLVFCHMDAHPPNSIYVPEENRIILLDYEMSSFSWAIHDLATFLEFSANGLKFDAAGSKRHPDSWRKEFLREYLITKHRLGDLDHVVTEKDVERLDILTLKAALCFTLFYSNVAIVVANNSRKVEAFSSRSIVEISLSELTWYWANKDRILAMKIPE